MVQELIQTVKATTGSAELLPGSGARRADPQRRRRGAAGQPGARKPRAPCRGHAAAADRRRAGAAGAGAVCRAKCGRSRRSTTRWRSFRVTLRSSSAPAAGPTSSVWWAARLAAEQTQPCRRRVAAAEGSRLRGHAGHGPSGIPSAAGEGQDGPDRVGGGHRRRDHRRRAVVVVAGACSPGVRLRTPLHGRRLAEQPARGATRSGRHRRPRRPLPAKPVTRWRRDARPRRMRPPAPQVRQPRLDTGRGASASASGATGRTLAAGSRRRRRPLGRELACRVSPVAGAGRDARRQAIDRGEDGGGASAKSASRLRRRRPAAAAVPPRLRRPRRSWFRPRLNRCLCRSLWSRRRRPLGPGGRRGDRSVHRGRLHGDAGRDRASRVAEGTAARRAARTRSAPSISSWTSRAMCCTSS